jgi:glycosyltransferase involved in cell wall biosynthesis
VTRVSVILPCRNEARFIGPCLDSFLATDYPKDQIELLVVDGCSNDHTREVVGRYTERYPWIMLLDNPQRIVPTALNIGIRASTGAVIVRMDAHVVYPPDYIPKLVAALASTDADNVGGRMITVPATKSPMADAIAMALSHPFGVGNSWFRIGTTEPRYVDTVPFGCWRRELFQRIGLFDEELVRNQDEELNYRLTRAGGKILLLPDVVSYYYARESPKLAARMLYQYGYFKPLVARKIGRIVTVRQLIPAAFVASLAIATALILVRPQLWPLLAVIVTTYLAATLLSAVGAIKERGLRRGLAMAGVFPVLHVSYGYGFLHGLWNIFINRRTRWRDPATVPLTR